MLIRCDPSVVTDSRPCGKWPIPEELERRQTQNPPELARHVTTGLLNTLENLLAGGPMRVAIIANIRLYREGLADLLTLRGFEVVGTASDGDGAVDCVRRLLPDVALLDMAVLDSTTTVRGLVERAPTVRVVAVAVPETERHVLACVEAGVSGYVPRDASLDDLTAVLHGTARGEALCSPKIAGGLLRRVAELAAEPQAPGARLTARELEILELIDRGLSNKEISRQLCIELSTVKNHVHNILKKLHVRRRTDAASAARRRASSPLAELDPTA